MEQVQNEPKPLPPAQIVQQNNSVEDEEVKKFNQQLSRLFKLFMEDIKKNEKIHSYLMEINITSGELLSSYTKILESNSQLVVKAKTNQIIKQSALKYFEFLLNFLKTKNTNDLDSKGRTVWYLQVEIKLHCCLEFFHNFKLSKDITNSPQEDYAHVWSKIHIEKPSNAKKIKKDYKSMKKLLHIATAATINESEHDFSIIKKISFGLAFPHYYIMNDSSKLRSFLFYRNPTLEMAQKIWNIPELGATKELSKIIFQGIKTNIKLYIPADGVFDKNLDIFQERPNTITVRVLYNKKLQKYPDFASTGCCQGSKQPITLDKILIHFHGGGFVALSSRSMQNYTRKWANQLGLPIFSVDYRMPPDHPFPQAPYDCLTVYRFILEHIHHYLNIKPTTIYLSGDSAGGNLSLSLTGLILKNKLMVPSGLYLSYPATDLRFIFTSSRLYAITDPLLWPSMLLLCLNAYLKGEIEKTNDPLASPILFTEQYINGTSGDFRFPLNWPKTVITAGNRDPLYDDSLMLMQRMVQSNIDCECIVYDQLSHGYLSTELFIKESQKTLQYSIQHLKKLIGLNHA